MHRPRAHLRHPSRTPGCAGRARRRYRPAATVRSCRPHPSRDKEKAAVPKEPHHVVATWRSDGGAETDPGVSGQGSQPQHYIAELPVGEPQHPCLFGQRDDLPHTYDPPLRLNSTSELLGALHDPDAHVHLCPAPPIEPAPRAGRPTTSRCGPHLKAHEGPEPSGTDRAGPRWAATMAGHGGDGLRTAHADSSAGLGSDDGAHPLRRLNARVPDVVSHPGATRAMAGEPAAPLPRSPMHGAPAFERPRSRLCIRPPSDGWRARPRSSSFPPTTDGHGSASMRSRWHRWATGCRPGVPSERGSSSRAIRAPAFWARPRRARERRHPSASFLPGRIRPRGSRSRRWQPQPVRRDPRRRPEPLLVAASPPPPLPRERWSAGPTASPTCATTGRTPVSAAVLAPAPSYPMWCTACAARHAPSSGAQPRSERAGWGMDDELAEDLRPLPAMQLRAHLPPASVTRGTVSGGGILRALGVALHRPPQPHPRRAQWRWARRGERPSRLRGPWPASQDDRPLPPWASPSASAGITNDSPGGRLPHRTLSFTPVMRAGPTPRSVSPTRRTPGPPLRWIRHTHRLAGVTAHPEGGNERNPGPRGHRRAPTRSTEQLVTRHRFGG